MSTSLLERPVAVFADGSSCRRQRSSSTRTRRATGREPAEQLRPLTQRRVGMTVPARTPPQRAEAYLTSVHWRSELARRAGLRTQPERRAVRRRHRRRGSRRAHRCGLCRLRGAAHRRSRTRGPGRPGRHERPDRELPRLPAGHQRRRAGQRRPPAGAALRRGDPRRRGDHPRRAEARRQLRVVA